MSLSWIQNNPDAVARPYIGRRDISQVVFLNAWLDGNWCPKPRPPASPRFIAISDRELGVIDQKGLEAISSRNLIPAIVILVTAVAASTT